MDAGDWDARYAASELVWGAEPNRFVVEEFTAVAPGRAVDLGAGEGRNALWLAERGWLVTAVDFSPVAAARARRLARNRGVDLDWVVADVVRYRPEPAGFDAALVAYLHLDPPLLAEVLHHAVAALAPGGRIVVIGHDVTNLEQGVGGPRDPRILYTPESILAELGELSVLRAGRATRPVPGADGPAQAIDTVVCAIKA